MPNRSSRASCWLDCVRFSAGAARQRKVDQQRFKLRRLRYGRLEIDRGARQARIDEHVPLTGYQFTLLLTLAEHAGRVMSRDLADGCGQGRIDGGLRPFD